MANICQNLLKIVHGADRFELFNRALRGSDLILEEGFDWVMDGIDVYFKFDTKWEPPLPCIDHISQSFPRVAISLEYREPGMQFEGRLGWFNGQRILDIRSDFNGEPSEAWDAWDNPIEKFIRARCCDSMKGDSS